MHRKLRSVSIDLFDSIDIEVLVDDLFLKWEPSTECIIELTLVSSGDEVMVQHMMDSTNFYDVDLDIRDRILYIKYKMQPKIMLGGNSYFEVINVNVTIPEDIPYKFINYKDYEE